VEEEILTANLPTTSRAYWFPYGCRSNGGGSIPRHGSSSAVPGATARPGVHTPWSPRSVHPSASAQLIADSCGVHPGHRSAPHRPGVDARTIAAWRRTARILGCAGPSRPPPPTPCVVCTLRTRTVHRPGRRAVVSVRPCCPPSGRGVRTAVRDHLQRPPAMSGLRLERALTLRCQPSSVQGRTGPPSAVDTAPDAPVSTADRCSPPSAHLRWLLVRRSSGQRATVPPPARPAGATGSCRRPRVCCRSVASGGDPGEVDPARRPPPARPGAQRHGQIGGKDQLAGLPVRVAGDQLVQQAPGGLGDTRMQQRPRHHHQHPTRPVASLI